MLKQNKETRVWLGSKSQENSIWKELYSPNTKVLVFPDKSPARGKIV
jgi:hypothetical protein